MPAGRKLVNVPGDAKSGPGWQWDSRGWLSITGDNVVLDGISTGEIDVYGANVTIQNSLVTVQGEHFGIALRSSKSTTIRDTTITSPAATGPNRLSVGIKDIYGDASGTLIQRVNVSHASTGIQMDHGTIVDSYIHDLGEASGDHLNGFTSNGGTEQLTLRHNTIFNQAEQTDAISLFQDFDTQANRLIDNNLLGGGGYTLYGGSGKKQSSNIVVTNNRFSRLFQPYGGQYGPVAYFSKTDPGNAWSNNVWDDTGATINP